MYKVLVTATAPVKTSGPEPRWRRLDNSDGNMGSTCLLSAIIQCLSFRGPCLRERPTFRAGRAGGCRHHYGFSAQDAAVPLTAASALLVPATGAGVLEVRRRGFRTGDTSTSAKSVSNEDLPGARVSRIAGSHVQISEPWDFPLSRQGHRLDVPPAAALTSRGVAGCSGSPRELVFVPAR